MPRTGADAERRTRRRRSVTSGIGLPVASTSAGRCWRSMQVFSGLPRGYPGLGARPHRRRTPSPLDSPRYQPRLRAAVRGELLCSRRPAGDRHASAIDLGWTAPIMAEEAGRHATEVATPRCLSLALFRAAIQRRSGGHHERRAGARTQVRRRLTTSLPPTCRGRNQRHVCQTLQDPRQRAASGPRTVVRRATEANSAPAPEGERRRPGLEQQLADVRN
jgi:hypothetical protein